MQTVTQVDVKSHRIVLIEDLRDIRESLTALINGTAGFKCVAAFGTMESALARIEREQPDVVLTDLGLPGMSGTEGIIRIREIFPEIPIIALTIYDNDTEIFNALCNGANGYLLKNTPPVLTVSAKRFSFAENTRIITLLDELTDIDFVGAERF